MSRAFVSLLAACLFLAAAAPAGAAADASRPAPPPVEAFFKDPDIAELKVSPDGKHVAFLSRLATGKIGVAIMNLETRAVEPLVGPSDNNVEFFHWKGNDRIVYGGDYEGNEMLALRSIGLTQRRVVPLAESYRERYAERANWAYVVSWLPESPDNILVLGNKEIGGLDAGFWRLNVRHGKRSLVELFNDWRTTHSHVAGSDGSILARVRHGHDGIHFEVRPDRRTRYTSAIKFDRDTLLWTPEFLTADDQTLYVTTADKTDTSSLHALNLRTAELGPSLFHDPHAEIEAVLASYDRKTLYGVLLEADKRRYHWLDANHARLQAQIDASLPHTFNIVRSSTPDEQLLVILAYSDRDPGTYYLFDRRVPRLMQFGKVLSGIDPAAMRPMEPIEFAARDGLKIHGYFTRPAGYDSKPAPTVVLVHGGPFGVRDSWGYKSEVQFLASRGYAVLQVNFRGSDGYGVSFAGKGAREWGGRMQDDITDGVRWAIEQKLADPDRIAIMGGSYGGYAALMGVIQTPELYRCAINKVGVTDLRILKSWGNSASVGTEKYLENWVGTEAEYVRSRSPVNLVQQIRVPTFHAYGFNDPRVDYDHWKRLKAKLEDHKKPFEEFVMSDEGHGFDNAEARIEFYKRVEAFLAKHMPAGG